MADDLFTRDEILAGAAAPTRRASALLLAIEARTAHLVTRSRRVTSGGFGEDDEHERALQYLDALALARAQPVAATIRHLEIHAAGWSALVPADARLRAALAHALGRKYVFTADAVPGLRAALGLDTAAVRQAYARLYQEPLDRIYAPRLGAGARLAWMWAAVARRVESLPPFWMAFALNLTGTVGAGVLALPIAMASVGPLAGVGLLGALALVNVVTITCMVQAITRSGAVRFGSAFVWRLVFDLLGRTGATILSAAAAVFLFLGLITFYVGLTAALSNTVGLPAPVGVAVAFAAGVWWVSRGSSVSSMATVLAIGALNITLIAFLCIVAAPHVTAQRLLRVDLPFVDGRPFDPSLLRLVFGVGLAAFFSHLSVSGFAPVTLRQDPSGRALLRGCLAAQGVAVLVYTAWVIVVNGAVEPDVLARETGTALRPLAQVAGGAVHAAGLAFAVLALGLTSMRAAGDLFAVMREPLRCLAGRVVTLPRRQETIVLRTGAAALGVTYLGREDGEAMFRIDAQTTSGLRRIVSAIGEHWDARDAVPGAPRATLRLVEAAEGYARVRVVAGTPIVRQPAPAADTALLDVLDLPDDTRRLLTWIVRRGEVTVRDVATRLATGEREARAMLERLARDGRIAARRDGADVRYLAHLGRRRAQHLPGAVAPRRWWGGRRLALADRLAGERTGTALAAMPMVAAFLVAEWIAITGRGTFAGLTNFRGVVLISLLGGVFPVLLALASRRRGEVTAAPLARATHPVMAGAAFVLFTLSLVVHGTIIWDHPGARASALASAGLVAAMTIAMVRRGAFAPRAAIVLHHPEGRPDDARFAVSVAGRPTAADVVVTTDAGEERRRVADGALAIPALTSVAFRFGDVRVRELRVWAVGFDASGAAEALPVVLDVRAGGDTRRFDLRLTGGSVTVPLAAAAVEATLRFRDPR